MRLDSLNAGARRASVRFGLGQCTTLFLYSFRKLSKRTPGAWRQFSSLSQPATVPAGRALYWDYVNPKWSRLLNVLQMDVRYDHCAGAELFTSDGRRILDFLSGYC